MHSPAAASAVRHLRGGPAWRMWVGKQGARLTWSCRCRIPLPLVVRLRLPAAPRRTKSASPTHGQHSRSSLTNLRAWRSRRCAARAAARQHPSTAHAVRGAAPWESGWSCQHPQAAACHRPLAASRGHRRRRRPGCWRRCRAPAAATARWAAGAGRAARRRWCRCVRAWRSAAGGWLARPRVPAEAPESPPPAARAWRGDGSCWLQRSGQRRAAEGRGQGQGATYVVALHLPVSAVRLALPAAVGRARLRGGTCTSPCTLSYSGRWGCGERGACNGHHSTITLEPISHSLEHPAP